GAVLVGIIAFRIARRRTQSLLGLSMPTPAAQQIDRRLIVGGLTFGAGWGLAGFCPGPALVSVPFGGGKALVFVFAMLLGMLMFEWIERAARPRPAPKST
ncbi:hypothetical protein E4K72_12465, partial [Oxalobacteraceae bacterium OM1]